MRYHEIPYLARVLENAKPVNTAQNIMGFSANVKQLYGDKSVLLGNAAEFLGPVFSSGVTIAVDVLDRQLKGEVVDWDKEFVVQLCKGVDTFRTFVIAWYDGRLKDVIFHQSANPKIKSMISSILASYGWAEKILL